MNDISYNSDYSDTAILKELGEFIKSRRIDQNLSQDEVATNAAISRSTLSLAEHGENISLVNLLKILRVLNALYVFEEFRTQHAISPLQLAREDQKKRKRASRSNRQTDNDKVEW